MSNVDEQLTYELKLFLVTADSIHSFRIRSKNTLQIMHPKYSVLDMIQRILVCCGLVGSKSVFCF